MRLRAPSLLVIGLLTSSITYAADGLPDSVSLEYGTGNDTRVARAGVQWDWDKTWFNSNGTHLGGYWDLSLAELQGRAWDGVSGRDHNVTDVGITPVFRFESNSKTGLYGELGIGANLMTPVYDNNHRRFSTAFEFGDHVGIGYQFENWSFGVKLEHFSNAGIKHPNPGANFAVFGVDIKL